MLRRHLVPFFGSGALDRVTTDEVAAYVQAQRRAGLARQTVINQVNFLHGLCAYALRRGWISTDPVVGVERPRAGNRDPDIRFSRSRSWRPSCGRLPTTLSAGWSALSI